MAHQARDRSFDRIAILVLAIEWVFFGSMHFSFVDATVAQIPDWIPFRHDVAIVTGILEVATGVLILLSDPRIRKAAAISSIVLLVLLTPAMYKILSNPEALASLGPAGAIAFRVVLLPNNIFMAICAVHVWRHPDARLERLDPRPRAAPQPWAFSKPMKLIVPALLLMANLAGFLALTLGVPGRLGLASLWAMGCIAAGALLGFLFGVPRANPAAATGRYLHNTNVEAVSDWLTKIVVGVSLVNLQTIGAFVDRQAAQLGPALGAPAAFATGLIVYFFLVGIIQGYILTRMFLPDQLFGETE